MNDWERILRDADRAGVRLAVAPEAAEAVRGDAVLFDAVQVPVVALSVVACIAGRRAGEPVHSLGARVGHTLMAAFPTFSRLGRYLQWSLRVRTVTADAIAFLEQSGLIVIAADEDRRTLLTDRGRDFVQQVRGSGDAGPLLLLLASAAARTRNQDLRLL